ncbi:8-oxo-dGTP pyrophosphatase MutT (NUDIX family) [Neorhizobium sp. 2083]|uniref:NUDIX hydrolase n=1 Tax=Neorhizobium sp. 2083 TaxID=2817762 RepID=UPI00285BE10A|nr:NUDIX hydrolase [Neorhizobium sp. 2083]MDR6821060.1 8-oxo-dGTP pyrophosphatase MutT (NUDIX family) [Neorhizobium sp. 2083]
MEQLVGPGSITPDDPDDLAQQVGALCYRQTPNGPEILLITTRGTGKWMIPKGWRIEGLTEREVAEREAWEEAGIVGRAKKRAFGSFSYIKVVGKDRKLSARVRVFLLRVRRQRNHYPEMSQRKLAWLSPQEAASRVKETELKRILILGCKILNEAYL